MWCVCGGGGGGEGGGYGFQFFFVSRSGLVPRAIQSDVEDAI